MKLRTKFQDEDFELGEVVDAIISTTSLVDTHIKLKAKAKRGGEHMFIFSRISELFELFEDYEGELKVAWYIDFQGDLHCASAEDNRWSLEKMIGNYFESEEEAKRAVEKLKAWRRLKDKGFRFCCDIEYESLCGNGFSIPLNAIMPPEAYTDIEVGKDLDLLFGGEE